jgi:Ca-activated chloride channel homolog
MVEEYRRNEMSCDLRFTIYDLNENAAAQKHVRYCESYSDDSCRGRDEAILSFWRLLLKMLHYILHYFHRNDDSPSIFPASPDTRPSSRTHNPCSLPLVPLFFFCLLSLTSTAQQERKPVRQGNELYQQKKYDEAEKKYDEALQKKPNLTEGIYNKGNVQYQKKDFENAKKQFETAAALSNSPHVKAKAYHNLGNVFLKEKKYKESVDAYKNALRLNPNDADTKYNLAYAMQMLKQNPSQKQQQKQDKDKDDNKDDKNQQQQEQQNKDEQSQNNQGNKEEKEKQEQKQNEQQQADKGEENKEKPQPRQAQISKAEAEKLLEALKNEEQKVQEKLQKNKGTPVKVKVEKDW